LPSDYGFSAEGVATNQLEALAGGQAQAMLGELAGAYLLMVPSQLTQRVLDLSTELQYNQLIHLGQASRQKTRHEWQAFSSSVAELKSHWAAADII